MCCRINEVGPVSDSLSGSTLKINFEVEVISPPHVSYLFRVLNHTVEDLLSLCMSVIGLTWEDGFQHIQLVRSCV